MKAIAEYNKVLLEEPDRHEVLINYGSSLTHLGFRTLGISLWQDSLLIKPDKYEVLSSILTTIKNLQTH